MPTIRNYAPGSIIYFEGDKADEIYILQSGKVVLNYTAIDTGAEVNETISNGEFFGVKSAVGKYPREETAQVLAPSVVLVLSVEEFEQMVLKNFRVLIKMLKVFSNQLRRIGKAVREKLQQGEPKMPATELFNIGEYYFKQGKAEQAKYVYNKYLFYYPNGEFAETCKSRLKAIESGEFRIEQPPQPQIEETKPEEEIISAPSVETEQVETEEKPKTEKPVPEGIDVVKKFYEALSLFSQDKIQEAMEIYKNILEIKKFKDEATAQFAEKAQFELGRCYMKLNMFAEAIETFANFIKKFERSNLLKDALFNIGQCYESMENYQKAINFYQKVVNMPPKEAINTKAKKAIEEVQKKL